MYIRRVYSFSFPLVRISHECGSQKPRSMISLHLRKLREEVERVKSEEFLERFMLALKSCLPNVPSDKYTIDQCIQVSLFIHSLLLKQCKSSKPFLLKSVFCDQLLLGIHKTNFENYGEP